MYINEKMRPAETVLGWGGKGEGWRGEFKYHIFDIM
jgi:hypothetical protein